MKPESIVGAVLGSILKVVFAVAVVYVIYRGASFCYEYGYRTFAEPAVSSGEGRVVEVSVTEDMTPAQIGELFERKGLIRDAKLFVLQYMFSEYREDVRSGDFELSTAMTVEEMMKTMTLEPVEEESAEEETAETPLDDVQAAEDEAE